MTVTVVGGGLAGCEAAWALAERGVTVTLCEMRPVVRTAAHQTDRLAELVCSNSFKSVELENAHGLLKAELRAPGQPAAAVRRRGARAGRLGARGGPRGLLRSGARAGHGASATSRVVRERGRRRSPSPGIVATGPLTSRPRWRRRSPRGSATRRARLLRRHRADREPPSRSITSGCTRSRATGRATATTTSTRRSTRDEYEAFIDALVAADQFTAPRLRPGAVLRGLPAGRGDGAPRARDAALRPDEAGRAARSAHRPRALRRGAAPPGGPGGADVEPGRLPDAAPDPGAAAGVPRRFRGSSDAEFLRYGSIHRNAYLNSPASLGAGARRRGTTTGSSSPGSSPASRATPSRSAPASWPGSTSRGGSRASRWRCRRPPRCSAGCYRYLREADPAHFQPMNANFGLLDPLPGRGEGCRKEARKAGAGGARRVDGSLTRRGRDADAGASGQPRLADAVRADR